MSKFVDDEIFLKRLLIIDIILYKISHWKNVKKSDIIICILNYFISMSDGGQEDLVMLRRVVYCLIVSLLLWTSMFYPNVYYFRM